MSTDGHTQQLSDTLGDCHIAEGRQSKRYRPKVSSLPTSLVRTIDLATDDGGDAVPTTIVLQLFSDRTFLSITQLSGKMGSLLNCTVEESIIDNSTTYHVGTLLGGSSDDQEVAFREVCVRRLAERMVGYARTLAGVKEGTILGGAEDGTGPILPLVVGLGLRPSKIGKRMSVESFNKMIDAAIALYEEGWRISHAGAMVGMEGPD
ncbi:hypothetical protein ACHAXT_007063 [Thalassiosira profunda]